VGASLALALLAVTPAQGQDETVAAPVEPAVEVEAAPAPPAFGPAVEPPPRFALGPLERAWRSPASDLSERITAVRRAADALGIGSLDPLARALLIDAAAGSRLERASGAVRLAPDLPAAQLALATARWEAGEGLGPALRAGMRALRALWSELESRLWLEATLLTCLQGAMLVAGLLWIAARGLVVAADAAHDLGDGIDASMPEFAKAAAIGVLVLATAAVGQGALGAALGLFGLAFAYGDRRERRALVAAAALVMLALGPLATAAGRRLEAFGRDPVALASWAAESGFVDAVDAVRLERAKTSDPLAQLALARRAKRDGELERAERLYAELLATDSEDPTLLNDAANVKLARGDMAGAVSLYRRAIAQQPTAELWFNLSQAHVREIDMESHAAALAAAQSIDPEVTSELTRRLSAGAEGFVVELSLPRERVRERLLGGGASAAGAALRATAAPGVLARSPWLGAAAFAAIGALGLLLSRAFERSRTCRDCGRRLCGRCGTGDPAAALCADCARTRLEARHGGPWEAAREREPSWRARATRALRWLARIAPGLAERDPVRPGLGLAALAAAIGAIRLWLGREGAVPDPATVGDVGPLALAAAASLLLLAYLGLSLGARWGGGRR
jgi:tetratricopeptide (TPR) repeat protein